MAVKQDWLQISLQILIRRFGRVLKFKPLLLVFTVCVTSSGCFPYHYTTRHGLSGTVVIAGTEKPLANASISFGLTNTAIAYSATNGTFDIPPKREWGIHFIPQDTFSYSCEVCVQHIGYEPYCTRLVLSANDLGKRAKRQLGVVSLKPLSQ
jgi:hypothetical protein